MRYTYNECQKQGELKDLKIDNFQKSLKELERFYKRKRLKRGIFHGTVGAFIGIAATYFILKKEVFSPDPFFPLKTVDKKELKIYHIYMS